MHKRAKLAIIAGAALLTISLLIAALLPREPRYQGLTMGQWLACRDHAQAHEALLILGTNNLPLLVNRLGYDRQKDPFARALTRLPAGLKLRRWLERRASRRATLSDQVSRVLGTIGTNAAPAIPELLALVDRGEPPAYRAMEILSNLQDDGLAAVASTFHSTNTLVRRRAVFLLLAHPQSRVARQALTNAFVDPDPKIRTFAQRYITNLSWYAPRPPRAAH